MSQAKRKVTGIFQVATQDGVRYDIIEMKLRAPASMNDDVPVYCTDRGAEVVRLDAETFRLGGQVATLA